MKNPLTIYKEIFSFIKSLDIRFKLMVAAIGIYQWAFNLPSNYNQLYVVSLGADPVELGSLNSVGGLVSSLVSAPVGWLIDRYGVKKMIVAGLLLAGSVAAIYFSAVNWVMLLPAVMLMQLSFRMIMPLTDIIFIGTSRASGRAQAMGFSRTVWALPAILAPMTAALVVAWFGGINAEGIRPLYLIQLTAILSAALLVYLKLEEPHVRQGYVRRPIEDMNILEGFKDLFKGEKWLTRWLLAMGLWRFAGSLAMPFIPLWMVYEKGADPYIIGGYGTAAIVASILLQIPVGVLADRAGRKKLFFTTRPFIYLGTILLLTAPTPELLIPVGFLGAVGFMGGMGSVSFTPFITMHWEMVPAEKRGRWFGLSGLTDMLTVPAYILGGLLWENGFEALVLILPLLIELAGVLPIVAVVPDTLGRLED